MKHDVVGLGGLWIARWMEGRASALFHVKRGWRGFSTAVAHRVWIVAGAYEVWGRAEVAVLVVGRLRGVAEVRLALICLGLD